MNKELLTKTLRNTIGAVLYIFLVSQIMSHGNALFGKEDNFFTPFVVLMLFSLSAAVVGGLVAGLPIILFIEKKRSEGVQALLYTVGWLAAFTALGLLTLFLIK